MCAIFGALIWDATASRASAANLILNRICEKSMERGRDGRGWAVQQLPTSPGGVTFEHKQITERSLEWKDSVRFFDNASYAAGAIGNLRAEPTTEYVKDKRTQDQQPYNVGPWTIVHNGTIANDKELRTDEIDTKIDSAAIVELLATDHMMERPPAEIGLYFASKIAELKGSYAILAMHAEHPGLILAATNYRPIWYAKTDYGVFFASARDYFEDGFVPQMVEPYSVWAFGPEVRSPLKVTVERGARALVVCSGGLDSVVAASAAIAAGYEVELLHFRYGSRAEGPELDAVSAVAAALDIPHHFFPMDIYDPSDSPLLQHDSKIAGGEEGAEFAHEWVPARNLVMLSLATACAEAKGFDVIILGNNLEEAGAYPDNEPEFINRFNDLLPFAVADGKKVRVEMPVGNLMKHEIVHLGNMLGAPLHLTWSCYRAGDLHCGTCGPCFMRRTAFEINGLDEVIEYAKGE